LQIRYTVNDTAGTELMAGLASGSSNSVLDPNVQLTERQALADAAERMSMSLASQISEGW